MTTDALPWLPDSALVDVRTADPVARCVQGWSDAWLCADRLSTSPRWEKSGQDANVGGFTQCAQGRGFSLTISEAARNELASLMLGCEISERSLRTSGDHAVIGDMVGRAIDDLARMLGEVLGGQDGRAGDDAFFLALACEAGPPLLRIEADRPALVRLACSWAGPPRVADRPDARKTALETQHLQLSAHVGSRRLALTEIEQLEVGDVLLLEHEVTAPIDACIDGERIGEAALTLMPGEAEFAFKIERPAIQW